MVSIVCLPTKASMQIVLRHFTHLKILSSCCHKTTHILAWHHTQEATLLPAVSSDRTT